MFITIIILTTLFCILGIIGVFTKKKENFLKIDKIDMAMLVIGAVDLVMIGIYKIF